MENKRKYKLSYNFDYVDKKETIEKILIEHAIKSIQSCILSFENNEWLKFAHFTINKNSIMI